MSEEVNNPYQEVLARKIQDNDLHFLVKVANFANANYGVTLLSKGSLIAGVIISEREYYESVGGTFGARGESAPATAEYFWKKSEKSPKPEDYKEYEGEKEFDFINLKKVRVNSNSGGFGNINNAFLRMKLEEVDGYILGTPSD